MTSIDPESYEYLKLIDTTDLTPEQLNKLDELLKMYEDSRNISGDAKKESI